ncbi:MAG: hypothetical protein WA418_39195, partial [Bradyrhizobium sp.]
MTKTTRADYLSHFPHDGTDNSLRLQALIEARDNRKFEIDLYWKRAGYFWLFIGAMFVAYVSPQAQSAPALAFLVACSGFVFSLAWYFANRGSKFWQENWEFHVDLLEDDISGPAYKTVVYEDQHRLYALHKPYPFSVSKINQLLSLYMTAVWLGLIVRTLAAVCDAPNFMPTKYKALIILVCTTVAAVSLYIFGRT